MEIQQLKLLAGRLRGVLEQQDRPVTHGQALDLIAALPGLRNWPEVSAFSDRVGVCQLDVSTLNRLAYRLKRRHQLAIDPGELLNALSAPNTVRPASAPQVWPSGPPPGVYVTASQAA